MARSRRGRGGRGQQTRDPQEMAWYRMDLHLHTPASADYQDLSATYLEILRTADERGLDVVAVTDHNSVSGIAAMRREVEDLQLLAELDRLTPAEKEILDEYHRLQEKLLILPGFEFTAAYGFHILGIFPPETTVRRLEYLLMTLNIPEDQMETGSGQVNGIADVLTAYEVINEHGGLVIPAHVNAAHGVAMQNFRFGGPTKVAYTQSEYIHALEVTDLDDATRRGTASFFNGSRPEYPRRMHAIQGSDAHRLSRDGAHRDTDLGVGDRATDVQLPERSFAALKALFASEEFSRIRPAHSSVAASQDAIQAAREQGPTIGQSFHEQVRSRRSRYRPITKDVVAFANTNGGIIYVGVSASSAQAVVGVPNAEEAARGLGDAIARSVVPKLDVTVEVESSGGKPVLIVTVPKGLNTPYATDAGQVFVRQETASVVALRDEIVQLVREAADIAPQTVTEPNGIRAWTAPRQTVDDDDESETESDDATPEEARDKPQAEIVEVEAEAEAESEERRAPRRRRSRRRPPTEQPQPEAEASPSSPSEPEAAPIVYVLDIPETPTTITESEQPIAAVATDAGITPPASPDDLATVPVETIAAVEPSATDAPKPRPRRRSRKAATPSDTPAETIATAPEAPGEVIAAVAEPIAAPTADVPAAEVTKPTSASEDTPVPTARPNGDSIPPVPTTGVEILAVEDRDGERYYSMRDLKSGRAADNVTKKSSRRLWRQAIIERENQQAHPDAILWEERLGYGGSAERDGVRRYTLTLRDNGGDIRTFYAVSDDGLDDAWRALIAAKGA